MKRYLSSMQIIVSNNNNNQGELNNNYHDFDCDQMPTIKCCWCKDDNQRDTNPDQFDENFDAAQSNVSIISSTNKENTTTLQYGGNNGSRIVVRVLTSSK